MTTPLWHARVQAQAGVVRRDQLRAAGVTDGQIRAHLHAGRWQSATRAVLVTTNGPLTAEQRLWVAVLHGGDGAVLAGLHAAQLAGLANWHRDEIAVIVPYESGRPPRLEGVRYLRSRRAVYAMQARSPGIARLRIEPAILLWASEQDHHGTIRGVLSAAIQQRRADLVILTEWIERLAPLRRAGPMREMLDDIAGGSHSKAEHDVLVMCRRFGLALPHRQTKRRDATGRVRFTDTEWWLPGGRVIMLEVDGSFHMDVDHWEDDIARQRALASPLTTQIRCTAAEAREGSAVAQDLLRVGVPRAA